MIKVGSIAYKRFERRIWVKARSFTHFFHKFSMRLSTLLLFLLWRCFHCGCRVLWSCWGSALWGSNPTSPSARIALAFASTSLGWCMGRLSVLTSVRKLCVIRSADQELGVKVGIDNKFQISSLGSRIAVIFQGAQRCCYRRCRSCMSVDILQHFLWCIFVYRVAWSVQVCQVLYNRGRLVSCACLLFL